MVNSVTLNINGNEIKFFENLSFEKSLSNLSGAFSFSMNAPSKIEDILVLAGAPCAILVDGERMVSGYIEKLKVDARRDSHNILIEGRDKTADIIDSSLKGRQVNAPITLRNLIVLIITNLGFQVVPSQKLSAEEIFTNKIAVIDNVNPPSFTTNELIKIRMAENAWNAIKRFAQKRQVLISSDENGNIVIDKLATETSTTILQNVDEGTQAGRNQNNNLMFLNFNLDLTKRFNSYFSASEVEEGLAAAIPAERRAETLVRTDSGQSGSAVDDQVRSTRKMVEIAPVSMTSEDCRNKAIWEANIRKSNSYVYSCEVFGFRQNLKKNLNENPLWKPNQLVTINDDFSGITTPMLVESARYTKSISGGTKTKLKLVDREAYQLLLSKPSINKQEASSKLLFEDV